MGLVSSQPLEEKSGKVTEFEKNLEKIVGGLNKTEVVKQETGKDIAVQLTEKEKFREELKNMWFFKAAQAAPAQPSPKWSLLQVPNQFLTEEQIKEQIDYQKFVAVLPNSDKKADPTDAEINSVLEITALKALFKLEERTYAYQMFVEAIRDRDYGKVLEFVFHNAGLIEAIAKDSGSLRIKKSEKFSSKLDFHLEGICPSALIPKIIEKQAERQEERKKDMEKMKTETKDDWDVIIKEEDLGKEIVQEEEQPGNCDGEAEDASNTSNYSDARSGSVTGDSSKDENSENQGCDMIKELERISGEKKHIEETLTTPTNDRDPVKGFNDKMDKLLVGIDIKNEEEKPARNRKEEDKKAQHEKEQFDQSLRNMYQKQDEKEAKEMNEKAREEMSRQLKTFREMMKKMETEARKAEELEMKQAKARSDQEMEKFRKLMEEKKETHRIAMEGMRKERERIEKETEEACRQHLADFQARTEAFWQCVLLKLKWEEQEEEWADWIKTLKASIVRVKVQFMNCEGSLRNYRDDKESESLEMIRIDLSFLRQKALSCHELLYDAFFHLKDLSEQVPDRLFLRILMKSLQEVADKILVVLKGIDEEINEDTHEKLKGMLGTIDASDVFATWKLREVSKSARPEDYSDVRDPMKYEPKGPEIQEVQEDSESEEPHENQEERD